MRYVYSIFALVWMVLGIMDWTQGDKEGFRYAFIMFWFMMIMSGLEDVKKKQS